MCSRCCRGLTNALYNCLRGRGPNEAKSSLLGPSSVCMICSGVDCQFCKQCRSAACRYATMYMTHAGRAG